MTTLLTGHRHSHAARLDGTPPALVPRQVKRVEDYIHAHADQPIAMQDLVTVAGVSARSIHHAFRQCRGYSPKALLRSVRLDRARERLLTAGAGENVTGIAFELAEYKNYFLFSTLNLDDDRLSIGILGYVWVEVESE